MPFNVGSEPIYYVSCLVEKEEELLSFLTLNEKDAWKKNILTIVLAL